jgi:hypothetical protein
MRVVELRTVLGKYDQKTLNDIVVELYKSIPKKIKEEKEIDRLLTDYSEYKKEGKTKREIPTNFEALVDEILQFASYADAQFFFAPNRYVPKKERPKWRFRARKYIKTLMAVKGEQATVAANLLILLYRMLSYACAYWIFSTDMPFSSVGYGQTELLEMVLGKNFHYGVTKENLMKAVAVVVESHSDRVTLNGELQTVLISCLKTNEAISLAVEVSDDYLQNRLGQGFSDGLFRDSRSLDEFRRGEMKENAVGLIFHLKMSLYEYDEAIRFYWRQNTSRKEREREIALYVLLSRLRAYELSELWISEYEKAVRGKIHPRESLAAQYARLKKTGSFDDTD